MPGFKSIAHLCLLLLLLSIPLVAVSAQSNEPKFEVGAQFSVLGGGRDYLFGSSTSVGGGARLTYNLMQYLALEAEMNLFQRRYYDTPRYQGQFGVKAGMRFDNRFGVFGKVRPGFVNTYKNNYSLDLGGVLEFYPSRRWIVRVDIGDTIVNRRSYIVYDIPLYRSFGVGALSSPSHNLQLGAGMGFRF